MATTETDRLVIRPPVEDDRRRFVELFTDETFTVFSTGVHDVDSANARFDRMLALAGLVPYAKQPVIEKASARGNRRFHHLKRLYGSILNTRRPLSSRKSRHS